MVNVKYASRMVDELSMMKLFPARDESGRVGLVRMVCEMATEDEQVRWLITRMLNLYAEWPGAREMRACFCSRFRPADGVNACSTVYLDGIPSERTAAKQIAPPAYKALPPGDPVSADPEIAAEIKSGARKLSRRIADRPLTKADIAAAPSWLRRLEGYDA